MLPRLKLLFFKHNTDFRGRVKSHGPGEDQVIHFPVGPGAPVSRLLSVTSTLWLILCDRMDSSARKLALQRSILLGTSIPLLLLMIQATSQPLCCRKISSLKSSSATNKGA